MFCFNLQIITFILWHANLSQMLGFVVFGSLVVRYLLSVSLTEMSEDKKSYLFYRCMGNLHCTTCS